MEDANLQRCCSTRPQECNEEHKKGGLLIANLFIAPFGIAAKESLI